MDVGTHASVVALLSLLTACDRSAGGREASEARSPEQVWIAEAPVCPVLERPPIDTSHWRVAASGGEVRTFRLPPEFRRDTTFAPVHGGARWSDASSTATSSQDAAARERAVEVLYGQWNPSSFRDWRRLDRCRDEVGGQPLIVVRALDSAGVWRAAWPVDSGESRTPLLTVSSPSADGTDDDLFHHLRLVVFQAGASDR